MEKSGDFLLSVPASNVWRERKEDKQREAGGGGEKVRDHMACASVFCLPVSCLRARPRN